MRQDRRPSFPAQTSDEMVFMSHQGEEFIYVMEGRVVKGMNFVNLVDAGDPVVNAKAYEKQLADELCFLDITASHEQRRTILNVIEGVAK